MKVALNSPNIALPVIAYYKIKVHLCLASYMLLNAASVGNVEVAFAINKHSPLQIGSIFLLKTWCTLQPCSWQKLISWWENFHNTQTLVR